MFQGIILQKCQTISNSNSVIASKGSTLCRNIIPFNLKLQSIPGKVMAAARFLFTYHVHMSLKHHCRSIFIALCCRLEYHHIVTFILNITQSMLFGKAYQIITDFPGIPGTMGNFGYFLKIMKHPFRL